MREISIPEPVALNIMGNQWTFYRCVEHLVDNCPALNGSGPGIRQGARILQALEPKLALVGVMLRDEDWAVLAQEMEAPTAGYHPKLYVMREDGKPGEPVTVPDRLLLPYLEAVANARLVGDG